ncbi:MAG: glycerol-3-phosphate dehydrogenase [Flavobacteriaceae bacterium]|nr:glycerol-3-phosphate dehydrogenase [Flavobacteriaceae bacterium]
MSEKKTLPKIGVVGSGSFATAVVKMLMENCEKVHWLLREDGTKEALLSQGSNPHYLTSVKFNPERLVLTMDINELVSVCDVVILATPSIYLASAMEKLNCDYSNKIFASVIKGIVPEHNDIVANYLRDVFKIGYRNQAVLAGPCHAEEVAMERLSFLTVAAAEKEVSQMLSDALSSRYIRINQSCDILGNEYSAVLKNIYAIGAGMASGLGYGDNFQAVYISNAVRELEGILDAVYPEPRNVNESSYIGDLLVTAYSLFSRNRMLGNLIGKGYTVKSAIQSMSMVAEGYYATKGIYEIVKNKNINAPIIKCIYQILHEEKNCQTEFEYLIEKLN